MDSVDYSFFIVILRKHLSSYRVQSAAFARFQIDIKKIFSFRNWILCVCQIQITHCGVLKTVQNSQRSGQTRYRISWSFWEIFLARRCFAISQHWKFRNIAKKSAVICFFFGLLRWLAEKKIAMTILMMGWI